MQRMRPTRNPLLVAARLAAVFCVAAPFFFAATAASAASAAAPDPVSEYSVTPPTLNIPIPGLTFARQLIPIGGFLEIPFLAQYIAAVSRYLVGVSIIAAAIMIVYGGFKYIVSSTGAGVQTGKDVITDAIIGLLLILGAYVILLTVNPATVELKGLKLQYVLPIEFKFMSDTAGFRDAASAKENDKKTAKIVGSAPLIAGGEGENVSIDGIVEKGEKPSQRLQSYCTSAADKSKLETYDDKIEALVRAVLGFWKICVNDEPAGCAYVRGGWTDLNSGKVTAGASDVPFLINFFNAHNISWSWPGTCSTRWVGEVMTIVPSTLPGDMWFKRSAEDCPDTNMSCTVRVRPYADVFYKRRSQAFMSDFEYTNGGGSCYSALHQTYQQSYADLLSEQGIFGGDCGTTLSAIYTCAGGEVGRKFGGSDTNLFYYINNYDQAPGKDFIVTRAKDLSDLDEQIRKAGGLKFGDIVVVGSGGSQHNFMFTGGRADVLFEIFEMGTGSPGVPKGCVTLKGVGSVCGMATHPPGSFYSYINEHASKWFPISILRPYEFKPCASKSECQEGEICLCGDPSVDKIVCRPVKNAQGIVTGNECKCAMQNICRKPKARGNVASYCKNDENCPRGEICVTKENIGSVCPKGNYSCFQNRCWPAS